MMTGRILTLALFFASLATHVMADGGRLRFSRTSGPFIITLFTTPEPLTPGPADFSVMVQDAKSGDILNDAQVYLTLTPADGPLVHAAATHGVATNRLLQAAQIDLASSGPWHVQVDVHQGAQTTSLNADIIVQQGSRKTALVCVFVALPILVLLLFIVHQRQKAMLLRRVYRAFR